MTDLLGNRNVKFGSAGIVIQPESATTLQPTILQFGAVTFTMKNEVVTSKTGLGRDAAAYHGTQTAELSIVCRSAPPIVIGELAGALVNEQAANTGWHIEVQGFRGVSGTAGIGIKSGETPTHSGLFNLQFASTGTPALATAKITAVGFFDSDREGNVDVTAADLGLELLSESVYVAGDKVSFQIYSPQVGGGQILYGGVKAGNASVTCLRDSNSSRSGESQANNLYIPRCVSMGDQAMSMSPNELAEQTFSFVCLYDPELQLANGDKGGFAIENYSYPLLTDRS